MVREHHDIVVRRLLAFAFRRSDHDGRVHALLLLSAGMAVIPVGTGLPDLEPIGEGLTRPDAAKAHHRHAVHLVGHEDAVPVDRRILLQAIGDVHRHVLAFGPAQRRTGDLAIDGKHAARLAVDRDSRAIDDEIVGAGEYRRRSKTEGQQREAGERSSNRHGNLPKLKGSEQGFGSGSGRRQVLHGRETGQVAEQGGVARLGQ